MLVWLHIWGRDVSDTAPDGMNESVSESQMVVGLLL
jgi:hypothetical protein